MTTSGESLRALFKNRNFLLLWVSQLVLAFGDCLLQMGLLEFIQRNGFSARIESARLLFMAMLPGVVVAPIAMMFVDQWRRRVALAATDFIRGAMIVVLVLWLSVPQGGGSMRPAYVMMFLVSVGTTFYYPLRLAFIPNLVQTGQLIRANLLIWTSLAAANVLGRGVGGAFAEFFGPMPAIALDVLAFGVSAVLILRIRAENAQDFRPHNDGQRRKLTELREGFRYVMTHPSVLPLTAVSAAFSFVVAIFFVSAIGFATETLKMGTAGVGWLLATVGVGAGAGIAMLGQSKRLGHWEYLPFAQLFLIGAALVGLALTRNVTAVFLLSALLGACAATVMTPIDARLQSQVEDARCGAVFAARGMMNSIAMLAALGLQIGSATLKKMPPESVFGRLGAVALTLALIAVVLHVARRHVSFGGGRREI
jgi:predicted MFS family arabinose efflux permease